MFTAPALNYVYSTCGQLCKQHMLLTMFTAPAVNYVRSACCLLCSQRLVLQCLQRPLLTMFTAPVVDIFDVPALNNVYSAFLKSTLG
jgi:hypothetical protein